MAHLVQKDSATLENDEEGFLAGEDMPRGVWLHKDTVVTTRDSPLLFH
jgi:hypothetical protein